MSSWQARIARRVVGKILGSPDAPIDEQRAAMASLAKLPPSRSVSSEELQLAGVRCLRLTPTRSVTERHLVYLHGGAYALGSPESHAAWVRWWAVRANAAVTLVDYRLAPEHPYPAAIDDCTSVVQAMYETVAPGTLTIAGDSAGGGAALATLCRLRDNGYPMPAGAVLFSPWTDLTASGESLTTRREVDPMIDPDWIQPFADHYRGATPADHPEVSPLFADLSGLPPTLIQVGDHEVLLNDSTRLAEKLTAARVVVELDIAAEMWHVYQAFYSMMPEARNALTRAAEFLGRATRGQLIDPRDQPGVVAT